MAFQSPFLAFLKGYLAASRLFLMLGNFDSRLIYSYIYANCVTFLLIILYFGYPSLIISIEKVVLGNALISIAPSVSL